MGEDGRLDTTERDRRLQRRSRGRMSDPVIKVRSRSRPRADEGRIKLLLQSLAAPSILVVDDLETNRDIATALLEEEDYNVAASAEAKVAIALLQVRHFDLVLMDVQMPVMDGLEATRAIRQLAKPFCDIPVLAMTSSITEADLANFRQAGMNGHVAKPFEPTSLYAEVERIVSSSRSEMERHAMALLDRSKLEEIVGVLGHDRVSQLTAKFAVQLKDSFMSTPDATKREAHDLINAAGILGLEQFAELCQEINAAPAPVGRKYDILIGAARRMKTRVLRLCRETIIPGLERNA
jgi:CheY-like chemotaxis protein